MTTLTHPLTGQVIEVSDASAGDWKAAGWLPTADAARSRAQDAEPAPANKKESTK